MKIFFSQGQMILIFIIMKKKKSVVHCLTQIVTVNLSKKLIITSESETKQNKKEKSGYKNLFNCTFTGYI